MEMLATHKRDAPHGRIAWDLDWNLLRTFMVIVEAQGISAAARQLRLKQPTISNALRRLEERLGRRLIERGRNRFEVTEAGALLHRECVDIFGSVARLSAMLREMRDELDGEVSIAVASHVVSPFFDRVLAEFHRANPRATFSFDVATSATVIERVTNKDAAFGLCLVHRTVPRLTYTRLYRQYFGFFCGPNHRLFGKSGLTLEDLQGEPTVSFKTDQLRDALRPIALLRATGEFDGQVVGTSSYLEEVRRMIVAGLGIGPLPIHVVERDLRDGLLWRLPPLENPPNIDVFVVHNPRAHLNRTERALLQTLLSRIAATPLSERTYR